MIQALVACRVEGEYPEDKGYSTTLPLEVTVVPWGRQFTLRVSPDGPLLVEFCLPNSVMQMIEEDMP